MSRGVRRAGLRAATLGATLLAACAPGGEAGRGLVVRDSAGVRIVESPEEARAPALRVQVEPEPALELGGGAGEELHHVTDAARLEGGTVVVANAGTHQLRVFSGAGRPLRALGRRGRGPGEFEGLEGVHALPGGRIAAWDGALSRLSVFDSAGALLRVWSPREGLGFYPQALGTLADGRLVLAGGFDGRIPAGAEVWRDTTTVRVVSPQDDAWTSLGRFPRAEYVVARPGGMIMVHPRPFARETRVAAAADRIYLSTAETPEVRVYDGEGRLRGLFRFAASPVPVTGEDVRAYRDLLLSVGAPAELREAQRRILDALPFPETMPPVRSLEVDPEGHLWIEEPRRGDGAARSRWRVMDADGRTLATVELPAIRVTQIGMDFVLGVARDEDGVERVRLYRLARSSR